MAHKVPSHLDTFATWDDVLAHVRAGGEVLYWSPMDVAPVPVVTADALDGSDTLAVFPLSRDANPFRADAGHLDRFLRPEFTPPVEG